MRVWDIPPAELCDRHLVGEHAEIHAVWSVISNRKRGYAFHPEVARWRHHLPALAARHAAVVREMKGRGMNHASTLPEAASFGSYEGIPLLDSLERQREILRLKHCPCPQPIVERSRSQRQKSTRPSIR